MSDTDIWRRAYFLEVGNDGEVFKLDSSFGDPARITFNVSIGADGLTAIAQITVYGLGPETRDKLYQVYDRVKLSAGYENNIALIFDGTIGTVSVGKQGAESFVTMYCRSSGKEYEEARVNRTWGGPTRPEQVIRDVAGTFGYQVEMIGDFSDLPTLIHGETISMSSRQAMRNLAERYGFHWMVKNYQTVVCKYDAYLPELWHISADTGMVGSPQVRERGVDVLVKMNPRINPFDRMLLQNATSELTFNNPNIAYFPDTIGTGEYGILSVTHVGDYYGDSWDTFIEGWLYGGRSGVAVSRTG